MRFWLGLALTAVSAAAQAQEVYDFDPQHTEVIASWNHLGFSRQRVEFDVADGTLILDEADPTQSSVRVSFQTAGLRSGVPLFDEHLKSKDWFDAAAHPEITFESRSVTLGPETGDGRRTAQVLGDLTIKGQARPVTLDVVLNALGDHPIARRKSAGFSARTTVNRSEWGLDAYAPAVSDAVEIIIETEANLR